MLKEYRMLSFVERWAIAPRHHHQSVAEHHYFVTLYASQLCHMLGIDTPGRVLVLNYALRHDVPEAWESDVPGPVKRSIFDPEKVKAYEEKFAEGMDDLYRISVSVASDVVFGRSDYGYGRKRYVIADIVKVADLIDEVFFLAYEQNLGNQLVRGLYQREMNRLDHAAVDLAGDQFAGDLLNLIGEQIARISSEGAVIPANDTDIKGTQPTHTGAPDA